MIKAVIFDLYGTLLYNKDRHERIVKIIGEENRNLYDKMRRKWQGHKFNKDAEFFQEFIKEAKLPEKMLPILLKYWNSQIKYTHLYHDTEKMLKALKKKGLKLGVVSNSFPITNKIISRLKIGKYFDAVILSFQIGVVKPDEKIYRIALKKLKAKPEETLFIGDDFKNDVKAAKKIGMKTFYVRTKRKISNLIELFVKL